MKAKTSPTRVRKRIRLKSINELITCKICKGYLIDAVTITECLHTFCKSCIVKYLKNRIDCPQCNITIHQSHPLNYISHDRTLQDIIYKVVPNLLDKERHSRTEFYRKKGMSLPETEALLAETNRHSWAKNGNASPQKSPQLPVSSNFTDYHRNDEQVNISLEPGNCDLAPLSKKYLRLSALATVTHLKKYVAKVVFTDMTKFSQIDIFFKRSNDFLTLLGKDHLLKFVNVIHWKAQGYGDKPMPLIYSLREPQSMS